MRRPRMKFHISYQLIVWALVTIAIILAGGFLIISYIYKLQDETNLLIQQNIRSSKSAQELKLSLYDIRAASLTYLFDRSPERIATLQNKQNEFILLLEIAKASANTDEENILIQQISALFSNYQQTLRNALELHRMGRISQPNALIVHASQNLINTIEEKTDSFIATNESAQAAYERSIQLNDDIIRTAMYALGSSGIILGLILGWLIARIILNPIYKLVLKVRDAAGSEVVEHIKMSPGKELEELDLHINRLIGRINQAHEDLQKNRELLERSSKLAAIGKIAPALAHEIRNPLTAIKMLIYAMMQEPGISKDKLHDLEIITHEIDRVEGFLQNFLKYARPAKPQMQMVSIVPVIKETLQLMQPRFRQSNIRLTENHEHENLRIKADPDMIKQIVMNLVLNAIESMGQDGELSFTTQVKADDPENQLFQICISDTGSGIPDDIKDSLFDPFVKGKDQGVGLGLSISQRIAELHHGWISAANNSGKGATFTIHLPMNR
ncbi:MAG: ATP-binding protein [Bacteroidales bacterium]|nr:ATP-binding protein [Bacteroidales bacterium]